MSTKFYEAKAALMHERSINGDAWAKVTERRRQLERELDTLKRKEASHEQVLHNINEAIQALREIEDKDGE